MTPPNRRRISPSDILTTREAAELLNITTAQLGAEVRRGTITPLRVFPRLYLFSLRDVLDLQQGLDERHTRKVTRLVDRLKGEDG